MKASQEFTMFIDKHGQRASYKEGDDMKDLKRVVIKKGQEVPPAYVKELIEGNLDLLDVVYVNKVPQLPKEWDKVIKKKPVPRTLKIKKREYSQESLTVIYNKKSFAALRIIGDRFGVKDRSSRKLITEILKAQEEKQRAGL